MHLFRSALSACVMKDLSDIEYYMPLDRDRLSEEGRRNIERSSRHSNNSDIHTIYVDNESVNSTLVQANVNRIDVNNNNGNDEVDDDVFVDVATENRGE